MSTDKGLKKAKKSCGAESRELAKLETGIHDRVSIFSSCEYDM